VVFGNLTGYAAAKAMCEASCGNSPTAHVCESIEMVRFYSTGGTISGSGSGRTVSGIDTGTASNGANDCKGFLSSTAMGSAGWAWDSTGGSPLAPNCSGTMPLLCCD
jgi:hypothetical protein